MTTKNTTTEQGVTETPETKPAAKKTTKRTTKKATPKKSTKKKTTKAKKATPKKTAKKTTKKSTPAKKTTTKKRAKKEGLRKPQVRILQWLAKKGSNNPQTRAQIAAGAKVDLALCTSYLGSPNDETRLRNDQKMFPSLVTLKLVKQTQNDLNGRDVMAYEITATGKKEAAKA